MYIPPHYNESDHNEIVNFIKTYSFGTIVTVKDGVPSASHLPFVISEMDNTIVLTSHFSKANPQSMELQARPVLVIFSEPHAYISPKNYISELNVPTWNYVSVHLYGAGEVITDQAEAFSILKSMINTYEEEYADQWDRLPEEFRLRMVNGIVPFQIKVTEVQAKKKLSQNKKEIERQNIISRFEHSLDANERAISDLMRENELRQNKK